MGYSPRGQKESDKTEQLRMHTLYIEHKVVALYYKKKKPKPSEFQSKSGPKGFRCIITQSLKLENYSVSLR